MPIVISNATTPLKKIRWIWDGRIVAGDVNLIDGRKGTGKSSVVAALLGMWNNEKYHKGDAPRLDNILWLSSEECFSSIIKPRIEQYGIEGYRIFSIQARDNSKTSMPVLPDDYDELKNAIASNRINALVVDPFSELKPLHWSINDADMMRSYVSSFTRLASQTDCTVFLLRHMRKGQGTHSGDDGMGSVQIKNAVRQPLRLDVSSGYPRRRFITVEESNISSVDKPFEYTIDENYGQSFGRVRFLAEFEGTAEEVRKMSESKVKRSKLEEAKRLLSEALKDGGKSAKQLITEAKEYGIGERTLDDAKADMGIRSHRKVDPSTGNGMWIWSLPDTSPGDEPAVNQGDDMQGTIYNLPEIKSPEDSPRVDAMQDFTRMAMAALMFDEMETKPSKTPKSPKPSKTPKSPKPSKATKASKTPKAAKGGVPNEKK